MSTVSTSGKDEEKSDKSIRSASTVVRCLKKKNGTSSALGVSSLVQPLLKPSKNWFVDSVAVMVVCPTHSKLALASMHDHPFSPNDAWFPMATMAAGPASAEQALYGLMNQLVPLPPVDTSTPQQLYTEPKLVHIMRLQVPKCLDFVTRTLFFTELTASKTECPCSSKVARHVGKNAITWYGFADALKLNNMHGPEPLIAASFQLTGSNKFSGFPENCLRSYEISVNKLNVAANTGPFSALFRAAGCSPKDLQLLYSDYVQSCFPSPYMVVHSFTEHLNRALPSLAASKDFDFRGLLRAFSSQPAPFIDFFDFAVGLAVLDPRTPHTGQCAIARNGCIFRYYNQSGDSGLSYKDLCNFACDLVRRRGEPAPADEDGLAQLLKPMYDRFGVPFKESVLLEAFTKAVGKDELRGISDLLRSPVPLMQQLRPLHRPLHFKLNSKLPCAQCREKQYTIAAHAVTIFQNGVVVDPVLLDHLADVKRMPKALRTLSDDMFRMQTLPNQMLSIMREYFFSTQTADWSHNSKRHKLLKQIKSLCDQVKSIMSKEPRILRVTSPCIVFGDLHGNLLDLMAYERIFWRMGPACATNNYLFLGDYVDRGVHSIEVVIYLMCCKLLAPDRFHLLRGNHELRQIQRQFTFLNECNRKFDRDGFDLWEQFNSAFDCFPVAAVIDDKIYCAHGGIPASEMNLKTLAELVPCPMENPLIDCLPVWELLWNDPVTKEEYDQQITQLREQKELVDRLPVGCTPNTKRATAFYFAPQAAHHFFAENGLTHVIRAHEVIMPGFTFHADGRVITVFSSSNYCGFNNKAAVMFVGPNNKIRPVKVETRWENN